MKSNLHSFCRRMADSLTGRYGEEIAQRVVGEGVSASASADTKARWAAQAVGRAMAEFAAEEMPAAMAGCCCGPNAGHLKESRDAWRDAGENLTQFVCLRNRQMKGAAGFELREGKLYLSYPACYCSLVKNSALPLPLEYCLCSREFTRRVFAETFGRPVEVRVLSSIKSGGQQCLFEVTLE